MKLLTLGFGIMLSLACLPMAAQTSFDELEFEMDSTTSTYRPTSKNHVLIRSKRGTGGLNKTAIADAILSAEVTEIVLVFSETEASDLAERDDANRERWENLIATYPELFQFSTTYKNVCQCKTGGNAETFKTTQGFYVYINGEVPKVAAEPVALTPPPAAPKTPAVEEKKPASSTTKTEPAPAKEVAKTDNTSVKIKEAPVVVEKQTPVAKETPKEPEAPAARENREEEASPAPVAAKPAPKKKVESNKPRRAKDPKACRQPCYGFGDEDLVAFFKDNLNLTKKQKKKAKKWVANVKLQINHDGTIKKAMVTGTEETFNQIVQDALKSMNNWNSAVKNGLAIKSEVRFTLKYDKSTKAMKPGDFMINPRPSPKCPCVTDSEMFD